jgi:Uma2 family endonuclease
LAWEYLSVAPEIVFEVRSPTDRWPVVLEKVAEYLAVGVAVACVVDQPTMSVHLYRTGGNSVVSADEELILPELHSDFRIPVRRIFD